MSWLRTSPLRQNVSRNGSGSFVPHQVKPLTTTNLRLRPIDSATDCDPRACYDSFCKHWQQAYEIIQHSEAPHRPPTHDDVLGVVSHLDFMVTLLLVELHHCNKIKLPSVDPSAPPAPCLEFVLSENLLDKLYEWGCSTGRYANAVRLEQLKLYELLVSHSRHQLLCHEPFLRPLLKILASSQDEIFPPDLEKRLVILLNQLCVVLMQNVHLLDLFFFSAQAQEHVQNANVAQSKSGVTTNFIIFSLLIPYVHREGSLGHQARDALLLCMALSQKNSNIGTYIAQYSSMCPLLVTGLGGLYSRLPNSIEITSTDWHRITPDDVTEISELTLFMNALEFCNAVVQVAHEMIKQQLLDFMYQGFIVPVLGPAILQTLKGKHLQTNIDSQISAMSYLDLILRSITEPGLLRAFVKFLLDDEKFDGERILDVLIDRLNSPDANLCMVTMALFDTLIGFHCEDLMLEILLKYVLPCKHVPISYRHKINKIDPYINSAEFFLDLTPDVMKRARELTKHKNISETVNTQTTYPSIPSPTSTMSKTIGANWNYYGLYTGDSLYANIHAYLFEAHWRIALCHKDCAKWANTYKYQKVPRGVQRSSTPYFDLVKQFFNEFSYYGLNTRSNVGNSFNILALENESGEKKQLDSLQSIGESSGYESFKWRPVDEDVDGSDVHSVGAGNTLSSSPKVENNFDNGSNIISTSSARREPWRMSNCKSDLFLTDLDYSEDLFTQGTVSLGPFLTAIWGKLQTFTSNTLYVNFHLTGLITRIAWYPLPLIHSLLLRPDIVITSDTPSFHQMLRILKQQIDAELPVTEDSLEIIDLARSYLIDREFRLMNVRKATENLHNLSVTHQTHSNQQQHHRSIYSTISAATPVQATLSSMYDPFRRSDNKRKSISKSITSMFSRKLTLSPSIGGAVTSLMASEPSTTTAVRGQPITNMCETSLSTALPYDKQCSDVMNSGMVEKKTPLTDATKGIASTIHVPVPDQIRLLNSQASQDNGDSSGIGNSEPVSFDSVSSSISIIANTSGNERTRDLALCAVLLDEWLKELAAVAQEQSLVLVNSNTL